jgi:pentose-5-phosphate-3-epimerase
MDGQFVPAISFGMLLVREIRAKTSLPLDVHLWWRNPGTFWTNCLPSVYAA